MKFTEFEDRRVCHDHDSFTPIFDLRILGMVNFMPSAVLNVDRNYNPKKRNFGLVLALVRQTKKRC